MKRSKCSFSVNSISYLRAVVFVCPGILVVVAHSWFLRLAVEIRLWYRYEMRYKYLFLSLVVHL